MHIKDVISFTGRFFGTSKLTRVRDEFGNRQVVTILKGVKDSELAHQDWFQTSPVIHKPIYTKLADFSVNVADIGKEVDYSGRNLYIIIISHAVILILFFYKVDNF